VDDSRCEPRLGFNFKSLFLQCVELIYAVVTAAVMEYTTGSLKAQTTDCEKNCLQPQTEPTW